MKGLGRKGKSTEADLQTIREYLEQFRQVFPLNGQMAEGTVLAGDFYVLVPHSLGRAYIGGHVVGASTVDTCHVQLPEEADQSGTDTAKQFVLFCNPPATVDTRVKVWIF